MFTAPHHAGGDPVTDRPAGDKWQTMRLVCCSLLPLVAAMACDGPKGSVVDATPPVDAPTPTCTPAPRWPTLTEVPEALHETGLFAADGSLAPDVRRFTPRFPLWSDGADKERFVYLPGCDPIDATDMDAWQLPVGTRLWKHFRVDGRLIETRFMARIGPQPEDWLFTTYAWDAEGRWAIRAVEDVIDALGTSHDIPAEGRCLTCHGGSPARALGFGALQLSHPGAGDELTIAALVDETRLPPAVRGGFEPPGDATAVAALGYLHANCGTCHNASTDTPLQLALRTGDAAVTDTETWRTAVGVPATSVVPGVPLRIAPGEPDRSLVPHRMGQRGSQAQMPPLGTERVDQPGLDAVRAWIESLPPAGTVDAGVDAPLIDAAIDASTGDAAIDASTVDASTVDAGTGAGCTSFDLQPVASGFTVPVYVTSEPGRPDRLYVVEKAGRIRLVVGGVVQPTPFLDLRAGGPHPLVHIPGAAAEGGLLGMVFDPDYATTGRFWLQYNAAPNGRITVGEFRRGTDPDVASTAPLDLPRRKLVDASHGGWNHCGGMLAFGPDGYLYAAIGDGASQPSPARTLTDVRGKILRIDVDSGAGAPGNIQGLVWNYGLRNPWRFSFDRAGGTMFIGDVGQNRREELDIQPTGDVPRDYGWPIMEGSLCMSAGCTPVGTPPAVEHTHAEATSIIGGFVYRGQASACLQGTYLYGDYGTSRFWTLRWTGAAVTDQREVTAAIGLPAGQHLVSFGEDAAGELYLVTIEGNVYRVSAN